MDGDHVLSLSDENTRCVDYAREYLGMLGSVEDEQRLGAIIKRAREEVRNEILSSPAFSVCNTCGEELIHG